MIFCTQQNDIVTTINITSASFIFLINANLGKKSLEFITFFWNVPSNAATITVLPRSAISSQNSTTSLNWNDLIKHHFTNNTGTPTSKVCTAM